MIRAYGVEQVQAAEQRRLAQVRAGALMQRAAAGLAATCLEVLRERRGRVAGARALLLVGAGNNGGDALWAGVRLAGRGVRVVAVALSPVVHAEGAAALQAAGGRLTRLEEVPDRDGAHDFGWGEFDLVVDGIVGLGGSPGLREPAAGLLARLRSAVPRPAVVAVDLPSGVAPDSGETPAPHVVADVTVTFGAAKPCLLLPPATRAAGRVVEVDIGLGPLLPPAAPVQRLTGADAAGLWPVPGPADDKYRRGVVGLVAGSAGYCGAAVLACAGAARAGAGMVRYVGPGPVADQVRAHWPEAVVGPGRVQAWVLGSGVDPAVDDGQAEAIGQALASGLPCLLDAGALDLIVARPDLRHRVGSQTLLTPHAGELARLLSGFARDRTGAGEGDGEGDGAGGAGAGAGAGDGAGAGAGTRGNAVRRSDVEARPLYHARLAAAATGATVLLKGSTTLLVAPDGRVRSQADAPGWLATAGAGDVLAGIAGALLAAGLDALDAGSLAVLVHGRAAAAACPGGPVTARDVAVAVPGVVAELLGGAKNSR